MGGRAVASAFKDLFLPPHVYHSREQIFNSGWSPQPFPPQRTQVTNTYIKGRRKAFILQQATSLKNKHYILSLCIVCKRFYPHNEEVATKH
ncbi:hypothetical protein J2Z66_000406 [Paenibacillus eucommiae]|uniref:Uncharacterized protein n=1 Tax=Paenibacillus eucommiae TaxID=1355755 RepID=A0ABS4IPG4_9BACL|nr:hypothetical protein [Paenibacillus eucommiae]